MFCSLCCAEDWFWPASELTLGALASVFAATLIQDVLYEVKPLDGSVFLTVAAVLLFVSTVAALIPALRAARVDPMQTLRDQ